MDVSLVKELKKQEHPFKLLPGDLMSHYPFGKIFIAENVPEEAGKFNLRDRVPTGLLAGKKVKKSLDLAFKYEEEFYFKDLHEYRKQQKVLINDRQLKADLSYELIVLMAWLSDCASGVLPISNEDHERVFLALGRINKATAHYINEGLL